MNNDCGDPGIDELEQRLGIRFSDRTLALRALTHGSHTDGARPTEDNQRLEFLGDAVLQLAVSRLLYDLPLEFSEGELTKFRAHLVNRSALDEVAGNLNLADFVRVGKSLRHGKHSTSILSDCVEALLGAIYLDSSFDTASALIKRLLSERLQTALKAGTPPESPKTRLQQLSLARWGKLPVYVHLPGEKSNEDFRFSVEVKLPKGQAAQGRGSSKKAAEEDAARTLLAIVADIPDRG